MPKGDKGPECLHQRKVADVAYRCRSRAPWRCRTYGTLLARAAFARLLVASKEGGVTGFGRVLQD